MFVKTIKKKKKKKKKKKDQRVAYKLASQEYLGCTCDQPMLGPFPAPPIFWEKSPGDEVSIGDGCW